MSVTTHVYNKYVIERWRFQVSTTVKKRLYRRFGQWHSLHDFLGKCYHKQIVYMFLARASGVNLIKQFKSERNFNQFLQSYFSFDCAEVVHMDAFLRTCTANYLHILPTFNHKYSS